MTPLRRRPTPAPQLQLPGDVRWTLTLARGLTVLGLLLLAAAAVTWFVHRPFFQLRTIEIRGDVHRIAPAALRQAVAKRVSGGFFTVDLAQTATAFEGVPWVRRAVVQRVWPNRLRVTLQEHEPAALWNDENGVRLVSTRGEVFEANVGAVEDELPTLQGPDDGSAARVLTLYRALQALWSARDMQITELVLSSRGSWSLKLDSGARIELGRGDDAQVVERAGLFLQTLPQISARLAAPLLYADLRHRDGYALRLAGVTTDPNPTKGGVRVAARPPAARPTPSNR